MKIVSERLGHASVGITLDTYSHVMPGMQEEAAEKIITELEGGTDCMKPETPESEAERRGGASTHSCTAKSPQDQADGFGGSTATLPLMIPRLRLPRSRSTAKASWPPSEVKRKALFLPRSPLRKIVILADWDVLGPLEQAEWCPGRLLADLLYHPYVERYRYADGGPPANIECKRGADGAEYVPGWAVLSDPFSPTSQHPWGIREIRYAQHETLHCAGIFNNRHEVAASDQATATYRDRPEMEAAAQRKADALASMVAERINADLFITDRQYVHEVSWDIAPGVTICRRDDALSLIGLYLRCQEEFVVRQYPKGTIRFNRGMYFLIATYELLPSVWRWLAGCAQHSRGCGDETLQLLGGSFLERVSRALQDRDGVHAALNKPQNNDTGDEALAALDATLLWLMGAVDVTARVVHSVLTISSKPRNAGWQKSGWRETVASSAPKLAALTGPGTDGEAVLNVLRLLRNSVHGEALQAIGLATKGAKRDRTLVGLPASDRDTLRKAFASTGGEAAWGVHLPIVDQLRVDPGVLLENLFPRVLGLLNEIMDETPVERLPQVTIRDADKGPPLADGSPYTEHNRQSIRWQLGL